MKKQQKKSKTIHFRVTPKAYKQLQAIANKAKDKPSVGGVIQKLIDKELKRRKP